MMRRLLLVAAVVAQCGFLPSHPTRARRLLSITPLTVAANDYNTVLLAMNPKAYWKMSETSGTNCNDFASGSNYDGTYTVSSALGFAGLLTSDPDTSCSFSGNDYVTMATGTGITPNSGDFTFMLWFKRSATSVYEELFTSWEWTPQNGFELRLDQTTSYLLFYLRQAGVGNQVVYASAMDNNVRHFVVCKYVRSTHTISMKIDNGVWTNQSTSIPTCTNWNSTPYIGRRYDGLYYGGFIEKVAFWGSVVSDANITTLYQLGVNGP